VTNSFLRKILAAGGLTRQGRLAEATEAIQRALSSAGRAGAHMYEDSAVVAAGEAKTGSIVLDGLVRVVDPVAPSANAATADGAVASADVASAEVVTADGVSADVVSPDVAAADVASPDPTHDVAAADAAEPSVIERPRPARFLGSSFTGAAGTRAFKLFAPGGFEGESLPLVVMLHGCTQDPDDFAVGTRMNELAQEHGVFVLYPAQAARSNAHKCWNWFAPGDQRRGAGEPALLAGMVRHVLQTNPVDPDRVYVAGLSAGGAMAAILAREYPDLFAAAGVHSGLPPGAAQDVASAFSAMKSGPAAARAGRHGFGLHPTRTAPAAQAGPAAQPARPAQAAQAAQPVQAAQTSTAGAPSRPSSAPVIVFHGDADAIVVASNGDAVIEAALAGHAGAIADAVDGVSAAGKRGARRTVWRAADAGGDSPTLAEQWIVHGAPHAWSGGAAAGSYTDPDGPEASREMLRFFLDHPRRRA